MFCTVLSAFSSLYSISFLLFEQLYALLAPLSFLLFAIRQYSFSQLEKLELSLGLIRLYTILFGNVSLVDNFSCLTWCVLSLSIFSSFRDRVPINCCVDYGVVRASAILILNEKLPSNSIYERIAFELLLLFPVPRLSSMNWARSQWIFLWSTFFGIVAINLYIHAKGRVVVFVATIPIVIKRIALISECFQYWCIQNQHRQRVVHSNNKLFS